MSEDRLIDQNAQAGDAGEDVDAAMRPKTLDGFIGQQKGRENLAVLFKQRSNAATRWTMCYWPARRVWAKPLWRKSLRGNWGRFPLNLGSGDFQSR